MDEGIINRISVEPMAIGTTRSMMSSTFLFVCIIVAIYTSSNWKGEKNTTWMIPSMHRVENTTSTTLPPRRRRRPGFKTIKEAADFAAESLLGSQKTGRLADLNSNWVTDTRIQPVIT